MKTKEQAIELINFLKTQEQYKDLVSLRLILQHAGDILYKEEKKQIKMDI